MADTSRIHVNADRNCVSQEVNSALRIRSQDNEDHSHLP
jgi:hypothetical protein